MKVSSLNIAILFSLIVNCAYYSQPIITNEQIISIGLINSSIYNIKKINENIYGAVGATMNDGHENMFFAKFAMDRLIFAKEFISENGCVARDFEKTSEDGFIIVGDKLGVGSIIKTDEDGDTVWTKLINV